MSQSKEQVAVDGEDGKNRHLFLFFSPRFFFRPPRLLSHDLRPSLASRSLRPRSLSLFLSRERYHETRIYTLEGLKSLRKVEQFALFAFCWRG